MEPSMRTFLLLALTLVAINGSKPATEKIILRETIESVEKIQKDESQKVRIKVDHFGFVLQQLLRGKKKKKKIQKV